MSEDVGLGHSFFGKPISLVLEFETVKTEVSLSPKTRPEIEIEKAA